MTDAEIVMDALRELEAAVSAALSALPAHTTVPLIEGIRLAEARREARRMIAKIGTAGEEKP